MLCSSKASNVGDGGYHHYYNDCIGTKCYNLWPWLVNQTECLVGPCKVGFGLGNRAGKCQRDPSLASQYGDMSLD